MFKILNHRFYYYLNLITRSKITRIFPNLLLRMSSTGNVAADDVIPITPLLDQINEKGAIQLGRFTLKSGHLSPIYVDLRVLVSTPKIIKIAANEICSAILAAGLEKQFDYVVGVPLGAITLAYSIALELGKPMLLKRKEAKNYGKKQMIEGWFERGRSALVIEDVVTSGASILETVQALRDEGLSCAHVFCVLDREQGGVAQLKEKGDIALHRMSTVLDFLVEQGTIDAARRAEIWHQLQHPELDMEYINAEEQTTNSKENGNCVQVDESAWNISTRIGSFPENSLNRTLAEIMVQKRTNVCLAVDHNEKAHILETVRAAAPYICVLKLHHDIVVDFDRDFAKELCTLAEQHRFLLFEDRKYADTGKTMELQLTGGTVPVAEWADVVTVHGLPGIASFRALKEIVDSPSHQMRGVLIVAELSTEGALTDTAYTRRCVQIAEQCNDTVVGFICQKRCHLDSKFLYWTPGVNLAASGDGKGQRWRGVEQAVAEDGGDIIVVGRGITGAADVAAEAKRYAQAGWEALTKRGRTETEMDLCV